MLHLDIAQLHRKGLASAVVVQVGWASDAEISVMRSVTGCLKLLYRHRSGDDEEWRTVEEMVPLLATQQRLGGRRQWFECPGCGRRCRILYGGVLHGAARFRCRHCHRLRYASTAETKADRAIRGMIKIVRCLDPNERCNELPKKPRRMHWRTYNRLVERYEHYGMQWGIEAMRRFGIKP